MLAKELKSIEELGLSAKTQKFFVDRGFNVGQLVFLGRRGIAGKHELNGRTVIISQEKLDELTKCLEKSHLVRYDLDGDLTKQIDVFYACLSDSVHPNLYNIWQKAYDYRLEDSEKFNEEYENYSIITKEDIGGLKAAIASRLTVSEYAIFMDHYGLESGKTVRRKELMKKYNLSESRIFGILARSLRKIKRDPNRFPTFEQLFLNAEQTEEKVVITEESNIELLNFSVRTYNALKRAGLNTLKDILDYPKDQWYQIKFFIPKSVQEICRKMCRLGYSEFYNVITK